LHQPASPAAEHCLICRQPLIYAEQPRAVTCHSCGLETTALISCPDGHYVCDLCHSRKPLELLPDFLPRIKSDTPEAILEELLELPGLTMHGPEHHPLGAIALLLACERHAVPLPEHWSAEAIRRGLQIPGGACGYLGACGAGVSLGIAVSLLTGATPVKGRERGWAHAAAAAGLQAAGDGHARCCKRALRRVVREGRRFLAAELGIVLPAEMESFTCLDHRRNRECPAAACRYSPLGTADEHLVGR